jgi:cation diffusion facilitator CzcD-associated flavoprotein CzcO
LLEQAARLRLRWQVRDPELRAKLTPSYRIGCKRIIVTDDYHPTLTRPNVDVICDGVREVCPGSIVTDDGTEHPVDAIVLGTGFDVMEVADPLIGRDGTPLAERWAPRREAYLGTTVAGYPNFFMLVGPNTATGHTSVLLYAESQIEYILHCLDYLDRRGLSSCEVRPEVQRTYNERIRAKLNGTVWTAGGCTSWYLDADGGTSAIWPGYTWEFSRALRTFRPEAYRLRAPGPVGALAA